MIKFWKWPLNFRASLARLWELLANCWVNGKAVGSAPPLVSKWDLPSVFLSGRPLAGIRAFRKRRANILHIWHSDRRLQKSGRFEAEGSVFFTTFGSDVLRLSIRETKTEKMADRKEIKAERKQHRCWKSSKVFNSESALSTHYGTRTSAKPYTCSICSATFGFKSSLSYHHMTHTGERPYKCTACPKSFSKKSGLATHLRTHTGEKPYRCDVCSKSLSTKGSLFQHVKTHTGEKPYSCAFCPKTFASSSHLRQHLTTHTGEKPYQCDVCSRSFGLRNSLSYHLKTHTGKGRSSVASVPSRSAI